MFKPTKYLITREQKKNTPATKKIPGSKEVANNGGGFSFECSPMAQLNRFLLIGSEGGTYYVSEKKLTKDNVKNLVKLIKTNGKQVIDEIVKISDAGRAPKNSPAIFALAMCVSAEELETRQYAMQNLSKVCRIGTHLEEFCSYISELRSFGNLLKRGINDWYLDKKIDSVVYQCIKYQSREGWAHRDILRLTHPEQYHKNPLSEDQTALIAWIKKGILPSFTDEKAMKLIQDFEKAKTAEGKELIALIKNSSLPMECIPTEKRDKKVYEAILPNSGLTFIVRNLGNLSKHGLLDQLSVNEKYIIGRFNDESEIQKARIHPINVLLALNTYRKGHGDKGKGTWEVNQRIVDALDSMFYKAFKNIEPTNKNILVGLDVSGSMCSSSSITGLSVRELSSAMCMVLAKTEPNCVIMAFSSGFIPVDFGKYSRLDQVINATRRMEFMGTDCSLPMEYAIQKRMDIDAFLIFTDSENKTGRRHPVQALKAHQELFGKHSKLIVNGMTATNMSVADSSNPDMLDICGFDSAIPQLISEFIR